MPLLLFLVLLVLPANATALPEDDLAARLRRLTPMQMDEVLWLGRCIYSESDRPHEQRLVAWVVRNRVETRYRGGTYREVVLETKQFSAFNSHTPRRAHILSLDLDSPNKAWRTALDIALDVYQADGSKRPFSVATRHFYSPVSMVGRSKPTWAEGVTALSSRALGVDPHRFQFFEQIDPELAGTPATITAIPSIKSDGGGTVVQTSASGLSKRLKLRGSVSRPMRPGVRRPGM